MLTETRTDPRALCLEITESVAVDDAESAIATLHRLKELGVRLSIDEFGTGNSSLGSLKRFPLDMLKIDRSFVLGLDSDPEDTAIVTAIISLAHSLGLETIADGVETKDQVDALRGAGLRDRPGPLLRPPAPERGDRRAARLARAGGRAARLDVAQPLGRAPGARRIPP